MIQKPSKKKERCVVLPPEVEDMMKMLFECLDHDKDGIVEVRELVKVCQDDAEVAEFFGLGEDPHPDDCKALFDDLDADGSRSITWLELKLWYWKVLLDLYRKHLEDNLPADPVWVGCGGQRAPERPLKRVSNDDLQEAALRGDVGLVRRLIEAGVSVNAPLKALCDDEYLTLLHVLACRPEMPNCARIIAEILYRRADVDTRSSLGCTPLMYACKHKHTGAVEVLLKHDADTECCDDMGFSALRCAITPRELLTESTAKRASVSLDRDSSGDLYYNEDWEQISCEIVDLLSRWGADMNNGGLISPLSEAALSDSDKLVKTLLDCKAKADGLHEAVKVASSSLIQVLVDAQANPFKKDADECTVMEVALARGDEEVTELIRDYIGKLEREQHHHFATMNATTKLQGTAQHRKGSMQSTGKSDEAEVVDTSHPLKKKVRKFCASVVKNNYYVSLMLIVLVVALILPDMFVVFQSTDAFFLDWMLVGIITLFFIEWILQLMGMWKTYACSFFFWMDLLGMLSVPLDHSLVDGLLVSSTTGADNSVLVRASRLARLGARAGRFTKLVKLLRFLPGIGDGKNHHKGAGTAKYISAKINRVLGMQVACLILFMCVSLPIFDLFRYPTEDFSMQAWTMMLDETAIGFPEVVNELIQDIENYYSSQVIFPYEVFVTFANGTNKTVRLSADEPVRIEKDTLKFEVGGAILTFNFSEPYQIEAVLNLALIMTICIMMVISAVLVSNAVQRTTLVPLETLLDAVQTITGAIFSSVAVMTNKIGSSKRNASCDLEDEEDPDDAGFFSETLLLERVLAKLQALAEIAMKKKQVVTSEAFQELGEADRDLLLNLTSTSHAKETDLEEFEEFGRVQTYTYFKGFVERTLEEHNISPSDLGEWDFDVTTLHESQRRILCVAIFTLYSPNTNIGGEGKSAETCALELVPIYTSFVNAVLAQYRDPKQVPYHNSVHAVDVMFTLHRIFQMNVVEEYLSMLERFALLVSALAHDIGHPGRNNAFLIESSHELALRYNDSSPLEHMHASKLFEIVRQEKSAIFSGIQLVQYKEVRHICIEAILYTDNAKHFGLVGELQILYEEHKTALDLSWDDYALHRGNWPSQDGLEHVVDFMRHTDTKRFLRTFWLHFCDVSNPAKPWHLCRHWASLIVEEFFLQGDVEKQIRIPVQPLNDREKVNIAYSQIGFIEFFLAPFVGHSAMLFPPLIVLESIVLENLGKWFTDWQENANPDEEEVEKVSERLAKVRENSVSARRGQSMDARGADQRAGSKRSHRQSHPHH